MGSRTQGLLMTQPAPVAGTPVHLKDVLSQCGNKKAPDGAMCGLQVDGGGIESGWWI